MAYLLGQVPVYPAVGCNAAKTVCFLLIISNHGIIHNNTISLHFFCFEEGEVVVNDMKKVPGNIGVELKEKKHDLVNNVPINGKNFCNYSASYLGKKQKLSKKRLEGNIVLS